MNDARWTSATHGGMGCRVRYGSKPELPAVILLHGWSGDENVMGVFESLLPEEVMIASPCGIFPMEDGGYNWVSGDRSSTNSISDFSQSVDSLIAMLDDLDRHYELDQNNLLLMGFSQGAALAFAATFLGRIKPAGIVSLAGFLPQGELKNVKNLPIYWGHGISDSLVPIERAREAVLTLKRAGANAVLCEADVGHKVGLECTRGLKEWFIREFSPDQMKKHVG
jgi:phospholipase/carboxylesterase